MVSFGGTRESSSERNWCTAIRICDWDVLECTFEHLCKKEIHFYQKTLIIEFIEIILGTGKPLPITDIQRNKNGSSFLILTLVCYFLQCYVVYFFNSNFHGFISIYFHTSYRKSDNHRVFVVVV